MKWDDIIKIVLTILASVGSVSGLIVAAVKFCGKEIAKRLSEKYTLKLNEELERYKSILEKKSHISKTKFDKEFLIYQELSEKHLSMVYCAGISALIVKGVEYNRDEQTEYLKQFCDKLNESEFSTKKYAPFIRKRVFEKYNQLDKLGKRILTLYKWLYYYKTPFINNGENYDEKTIKNQIIEKQEELSQLSDQILDDVRDYLDSLEVIE